MKVTFLTDHQSVQSGNSFYEAGTRADFPRGAALIEMGVAYEGWGPAPVVEPEPEAEPMPELHVGEPVEDKDVSADVPKTTRKTTRKTTTTRK